MFANQFKSEGKYLMLTGVTSVLAVCTINISALLIQESHHVSLEPSIGDFFGEMMLFFALFTFVVFGIKGFFEAYSKRTANIVIAVTGSALAFILISLAFVVMQMG